MFHHVLKMEHNIPPSSIVFVKLIIRAASPLKHPATTNSLGSFVEEVI